MSDIKQKNIELLSQYEPKSVLNYFANLCNIPHGSGNEQEIGKYIGDVLRPVSKEVIVYPDGTVYAYKEATPGFENKPMICLQAHSDMVCVKKPGSTHDFLKDPLDLVIEGDKLKTKDTSLGADDCIGVAYILDVFTNKNVKHGPIEALITASEETTMGGINAFPTGILKSKLLINLDHEMTSSICLGCCGGIEIALKNKFNREPSNELTQHMFICIKDGASGHSGNSIRFKIVNAIKEMFWLIKLASKNYKLALVSIDGGQYKNAIAADCTATIAVKPEDYEAIKKIFVDNFNEIKKEYFERETKLNINVEKSDKKQDPISFKQSNDIIDAYNSVVYGVFSLNEKYNIADGSNNIGIIHTNDNQIQSDFLLRSLYENCKHRILNSILSAFYGTDFTYDIIDDYPEWTPVIGKNILQDKFIEIYKKTYGSEPVSFVTEGGLETGVLAKKYPGIVAISIGPDIENAHTFDEYASLKKIASTYEVLKEMLETI